VIFMNLGIAESKMPDASCGDCLVWRRISQPPLMRPNAAAVKEQIAVLEVRNQSNVSRLLKTVQVAVDQIPVNRPYSVDSKAGRHGRVVCRIRRSCFGLEPHQIDGKRNSIEAPDSFHRRASASRDFASRVKTADIITRPTQYDALLAIGDAQLPPGFAGRADMALVGHSPNSERPLSDSELNHISEAQGKPAILPARSEPSPYQKRYLDNKSRKSSPQLAISKRRSRAAMSPAPLKTAKSFRTRV